MHAGAIAKSLCLNVILQGNLETGFVKTSKYSRPHITKYAGWKSLVLVFGPQRLVA